MEDKRTLHFTSQGFRAQEIEIAPDVSDVVSKRRPLIENEVCDMTAVLLKQLTLNTDRMLPWMAILLS